MKQWITPINKKGPKCEPSNYTLLENIIYTQVRGHIDTRGILTWFQQGFQARCSCETQQAVTLHDLHKLADSGTQVGMGILHFSKAFNVVPHTRLLNKL